MARATVPVLADHYGAGGPPVTVSAVNLQALTPLAQSLDTFSVVFLQWLSNDVIWRARERVVTRIAERARKRLELRPRGRRRWRSMTR